MNYALPLRWVLIVVEDARMAILARMKAKCSYNNSNRIPREPIVDEAVFETRCLSTSRGMSIQLFATLRSLAAHPWPPVGSHGYGKDWYFAA